MRTSWPFRRTAGGAAKLLGSVLLLGVLLFAVGGPASASQAGALAGEWSRLSVDQSNPGPEHERLHCVQNNGAQAGNSSDTWFCRYSKAPEPGLNFYWNNRQGFFSGRDVTATWACPAWFPAGSCSSVVQVVEGTMDFTQPSVGFSLSVLEDLVVTQSGGNQTLYIYWVDFGFACPWFRTFEEAVAANPLPLPFNGTWAPQDCFA
jgi:hypothetical protein